MICKIANEKKKLYFLFFLALTNYSQMFSAPDGYHRKGITSLRQNWSEEPLFKGHSQEVIPGQERQQTPMVL